MAKKGIRKPLAVTLFCIILMTAATMGVFFYLNHQYGVPASAADAAEQRRMAYREKNRNQPEPIETYQETCYHLIMTEGGEDGDALFMLEVLSTAAGRILFISIPGNTRITMSNTVYVELSGSVPEIPQIIQMQYVAAQAGPDRWADYTRKILEDGLDLSIPYYTVLPRQAFLELFDAESGKADLSESLKTLYQLPVTQRGTMQILQELYAADGFQSNLEFAVKCRYLEFYEALRPADFLFYAAEGKDMNEVFILDATKLKQAVYKHLQEEPPQAAGADNGGIG